MTRGAGLAPWFVAPLALAVHHVMWRGEARLRPGTSGASADVYALTG